MFRLVFALCLLLVGASTPATAQIVEEVREDIRVSVLPSARVLSPAGGVEPTTVFIAVSYNGENRIENCQLREDFTNTFAQRSGPHVFHFFLTNYGLNAHEMDAQGQLLSSADPLFFEPRQTRFFVGEIEFPTGESDRQLCGESGCDFEPVLECATGQTDGLNQGVIRHVAPDTRIGRAFPRRGNANTQPDILPVIATPSDDGFLRFNGTGSTAAAAMAAVNIGASAEVEIVPVAIGGVTPRICESDLQGQCLGGWGNRLTLTMGTDQPHYFSLRVRDVPEYSLGRAPGLNRLYVSFRYRDDDHTPRITIAGETSVALDEPSASEPQTMDLTRETQVWRSVRRQDSSEFLENQRNLHDIGYPLTLIIKAEGEVLTFGRPSGSRIGHISHCQVGCYEIEISRYRIEPGSSPLNSLDVQGDLTSVSQTAYEALRTQPLETWLTLSPVEGAEHLLLGTERYLDDGEESIARQFMLVRDFSRQGSLPFPGRYSFNGFGEGNIDSFILDIAADGQFTTHQTNACTMTGQFVPLGDRTGLYEMQSQITDCNDYLWGWRNTAPNGFAIFTQTADGTTVDGAIFHPNASQNPASALALQGSSLAD